MRNSILLFLTSLSFSLLGQGFQERVTTASNVRLTVTNVGTFGNAFRGYRDGTGQASCEYPSRSGIEHLFEGGIWIGGKENGSTIRVSTSAMDAPQGYAPGRGGFEFTVPSGEQFITRSSLKDNPNFSLQAVSHQDFVGTTTDENLTIPGTSIPINNHTNPMNLLVTVETYNWNFSFSDFMVIVNLKIKNNGNNFFDDLYVALWNNTVVRNVFVTPAGAGGAAFFNQGGNGYMDSLNLAYCFDATGDVGFTDSYIGQKFLGAESKYGFHHPLVDSAFNSSSGQLELDTNFKSHYNAWVFNNSAQPVFFFPTDDNQRYVKMSQGLNFNPCWTNPASAACQAGAASDLQALLNAPGNRSDLVSVGPFRRFEPGDEITVAFAYVLAKKNEDGQPNTENNLTQRENLVTNANWAQRAYNGEDANFNGRLDDGEDLDGDGKITRFILPSPPDIPKTRVEASNNTIDIYWSNNSEFSVDPISKMMDFEGYRVYMTRLGFDVNQVPNIAQDLKLIGSFDSAGNGLFFETGFGSIRLPEPVFFEDDTTAYHYRFTVNGIQNGWQYGISVTAFDRGNEASNLESLESSLLSNTVRVFSGTPPNEDMKKNEPFVYPNPYYYGSSWEGRSNFQEESRKIIFANLPARCQVRIFTVAGDFIDEFTHNEVYNGSDIRWFRTFGSENSDDNMFSGGEHAWDLLSLNTQIISRGLYMFSVKDLETGEMFLGKFVIIK